MCCSNEVITDFASVRSVGDANGTQYRLPVALGKSIKFLEIQIF